MNTQNTTLLDQIHALADQLGGTADGQQAEADKRREEVARVRADALANETRELDLIKAYEALANNIALARAAAIGRADQFRRIAQANDTPWQARTRKTEGAE